MSEMATHAAMGQHNFVSGCVVISTPVHQAPVSAGVFKRSTSAVLNHALAIFRPECIATQALVRRLYGYVATGSGAGHNGANIACHDVTSSPLLSPCLALRRPNAAEAPAA